METSRRCVNLEEPQRQLLEQWVRAHSTPQQVAKRCQIILQSAGGKSDQAIAMELDINRHTCRLWRERFVESGGDCLWEVEAGRGRKVQAGLAQRIVEATLHSKPAGQTHWTTRKLAKEQGVHASTVARIWQEHELKPHRQKTFKLSRDAKFVEKLLDVVGVYLNPPQHAIVLCVDEKCQIQALDRTQPGLPLKKGRAGTMTHDYERHGTTTLFAAMNVLDGTVIGQTCSAIAIRNSFASSMSSRSRSRRARRSTPSSTIAPPISIPTSADGSNAIRDGRSISHRHRLPGSTRSRASSRPSQSAGSSAASFGLSPTCKPQNQPLPRRAQPPLKALHLDRRSRQNHRRRQARAPSVRFDPLECRPM